MVLQGRTRFAAPSEGSAAAPAWSVPGGAPLPCTINRQGENRTFPPNTRHSTNSRRDDVRRSRRQSAGQGRRRPERGPAFQGWISTDEDEIKRREWRGRTEIDEVRALDGHLGPFCDYRVTSSSGSGYVVEIRSLEERINSCECRDFAANRLGTCKHVEGAVRRIGARGPHGSGGSSGRIEVFLDEREREPRLSLPAGAAREHPALAAEIERWYGDLRRGPSEASRALRGLRRGRGCRLPRRCVR